MSDEKKLSERVRGCAYIVPDPHPTDTDASEREVLGLNYVADEIATLEKRLAGWQPIETAPVGQRLLFWWSPIGDDKCAQDCVTGSLVYDLDSGERTGEWWNDQTGKYQDVIYLTHWKPLPPPPQENTHD